MSTLIVEQLMNGVTFEQPIKVKRTISIAHFRPWVLLHGTLASGQLQCKIRQGATVLSTKTIDYTLLNAAKTQAYAHGYIRFDFNGLVLGRAQGETETEYIVELSMVGYSNDFSNYVGVCREWESKSSLVYGDVDGFGNAVNSTVEPIGYQIFEYRS